MATLEDEEFKMSLSEFKLSNNGRFSKGASVEVSSDEDGLQGAWFAATVIEQVSSGNFSIQYKSLRNDEDTEFLTEVVDSKHIRPHPGDEVVDHFRVLEEVDALYNDAWWVGVISKVVGKKKYEVYFRDTDDEMVFKQSDLRRHKEWIDGNWVSCNLVDIIKK
ncbi:hypothetical protein LXL04_005940 [Taraxacum kok-saghyz]